jgi:hypothetical protein
VGETVQVTDFVSGDDVLSREALPTEVNWSFCQKQSWPDIAQAFGLPLAAHARRAAASVKAGSGISAGTLIVIVLIVIVLCILMASAPSGTTGVSGGSVGSYRGGGVFSGGK